MQNYAVILKDFIFTDINWNDMTIVHSINHPSFQFIGV